MAKLAILEEGILLSKKTIFGDNAEHEYDIQCYDGLAAVIGRPDLYLVYPTKEEVLNDELMAQQVLRYRGLTDLKPKDITFGDIMICLGKLKKK